MIHGCDNHDDDHDGSDGGGGCGDDDEEGKEEVDDDDDDADLILCRRLYLASTWPYQVSVIWADFYSSR